MIRLEELKAYQRTRIAGTDPPIDEARWPAAWLPAVSERLTMVRDAELEAIVDVT
jgi:hypothetical protein